MIVHRLTFAVLCYFALGQAISAQNAGHTPLRIGLVTPGGANVPQGAASVERGIRLGAAESKQTAALFGNDVELYDAEGAGSAALIAAERLLSVRQVQVLIGVSAADADLLSGFAESHHILFVNAASRSRALRAACRRYTFHVEATDAMYENAAAAAKHAPIITNTNDSGLRAGSRPDSVTLWGPSLQRFGASQINDRYRDKYQLGMDGFAWAGWAAVKIASEAALRTRSTSPAKLVSYLESPATQFDGHKGWPLTFRIADHQLRQPLYTATLLDGGGYRLTDVPELRDDSSVARSTDPDVRTPSKVLDFLIASPGARPCKWSGK
ncbi:MAG TPA: ABC transporter substrate-binding protein [Gemmatimonadaceae bacterium]|jgi:ABC-type branched-subunit amino acid transport system substrate-binding protein|nr:ABC transporter substrate-binding protein [Gemmatimonadaceae bacterium]